RKLASLSAAEVFRDILPEYKLRHQDYSDVKLKKDTLSLYKYEKELLEFYKRYLQRLEKAASVLRPKKGDKRKHDDPRVSLGLLSIKCMCTLLVARPNFNYATNIAQSVIPFLDTTPEARNTVTEACTDVFKEDNKGEITLAIVRLINQLAKRRGSRLNPAALDCLLQLKIQDVELDEEHDLKMKKKTEEKKKKRIVNLSKKEKKRAKKLKEVERELLETEAKESESARRKQLTEVTKTVFHIYFRLLKSSPTTGLLIAALNGIAKFTHVINLEYYSDLVSILSGLVRSSADRSTRLVVVGTVLAVLAKAGDALNVDPAVFHTHLYQDMLAVHAGCSRSETATVVECASAVCQRLRRVSCGVLRALAKRLLTMSSHGQHHAALASLALVWTIMQHNKHVSALFEAECAGSGRFDPLSPSPEHCGSHAALGYEGPILTSHYHPVVRAAAAALLQRGGWPKELHGLTPKQIFDQYDCSQLCFKPAIPPPKPRDLTKPKTSQTWARPDFKTYCETVEDNLNMDIDSFIER
ncbi:Nucleolar complex protein 3, partial [Danaus plexippus plexippus]